MINISGMLIIIANMKLVKIKIVFMNRYINIKISNFSVHKNEYSFIDDYYYLNRWSFFEFFLLLISN